MICPNCKNKDFYTLDDDNVAQLQFMFNLIKLSSGQSVSATPVVAPVTQKVEVTPVSQPESVVEVTKDVLPKELAKYNKDEDTDYIKNDYTDKYNIFVEKLQLCNFVFIDKSKNEDFYNSDFIIISNNSYPIIIDQDNHDLHIKIEDLNFFNEEDIESFYSQKYLKQLRIDMKKYYLKYDLKTRLLNIFNSGK